MVITAYGDGRVVEGTVHFRAVHDQGSAPHGTSPTFEAGRFRADVRVHTPGGR